MPVVHTAGEAVAQAACALPKGFSHGALALTNAAEEIAATDDVFAASGDFYFAACQLNEPAVVRRAQLASHYSVLKVLSTYYLLPTPYSLLLPLLLPLPLLLRSYDYYEDTEDSARRLRQILTSREVVRR